MCALTKHVSMIVRFAPPWPACRWALLSLAALLVAAPISPATAQVPRSSQRLLLVTQTVTEPGAGVRSTLAARVGTLAFAPGRLASDTGFEQIANASTLAQVAVRDYGSTLTQQQLLTLAITHFAGQAGAVASAMRTALQARGLAHGTFVFDQRVLIAGASLPRQLVWTLTVDSGGRYSFAEPQLFDQQPTLLHAQYVPLRVAAGLPQGWAWPDGGQLRWQLLDLQLQPVTAMMSVDTGGAFDPPDPVNGSAYDPDAGLRCLVDRSSNAGCAATLPDIVSLIDLNAAAGALVDYGRRVAPVYDPMRNAAGNTEQVARVSLQVTLREVTYSGCTADMAYRNAGRYGFTLQATTDRYQVSRNGRFSRLNTQQSLSLSPTQPYDWTRLLQPAAVASLSPLMLDPIDPARPLLETATVPNLLLVAPITVNGSETQTVASYLSPQTIYARLQLEIGCSVSGRWTARSMIAPWAQCRSGSCNAT
jgi:hypothetical protein